MEAAPLRAVPLRPTGPVDPAAALEHVTDALPRLDQEARRALALVEVGGLARDAAASAIGIDAPVCAAALARGRKALRRSVSPLPASGWCERAERLISDDIDDELPARARARLDAHLANCERCETHERRLAQARDRLVRSFLEAHPGPSRPEPIAAVPAPAAPKLRLHPETLAPAPATAAAGPEPEPPEPDGSNVADTSWPPELRGVVLAIAVIIVTAAGIVGLERIL